jgi:hypothetical protein
MNAAENAVSAVWPAEWFVAGCGWRVAQELATQAEIEPRSWPAPAADLQRMAPGLQTRDLPGRIDLLPLAKPQRFADLGS